MKYFVLNIMLIFFLSSCSSNAQQQDKVEKNSFPIQKTASEWKMELTPEQFYVLQAAGTERPYTSPLLNMTEKGKMVCVACGNVLFDNEYQYDAKCGWPSFDRAVEGAVVYGEDYKLGYKRIEVLCSQCGGHLGHVFKDGPRETTGQRYCINGVALEFESTENE